MPYLEITHEVMILKDGRVALGLQLFGEEWEKRSAPEYAALQQRLLAGLKSFPAGAVLQKIDVYDQQPFTVSSKEQGYFQSRQFRYFYHRPVLTHQAYLLLSLGHHQQPKANAVNSLFAFGKALLKHPMEGLQERAEQLERLGEEISVLLQSLGIGVRRLDDTGLQQLIDAYFNLDFADRVGEGRSEQRKLQKLPNGMSLGEKQVQLISLIGQGAQAEATSLENGLAGPFVRPLTHALQIPHLLITTIRVEQREKELKKLDLERKLNASLDFLSTQDNEVTQTELEAFTAEVRIGNDQLVSLQMGVVLWDTDRKALQRAVDQTVGAFRSLQGAECLVESMDTANLFVALAPGNAFQAYRWMLMRAENALCYWHFLSGYRAAKEGIYLCDRFQAPLLVRLFHPELNNQNAIVIGPSGSGKSFTVGSFIVQRFEQGHRQVIIDNGGTYKNAMTALGGAYYEYDPAAPLSFNPFWVPRTPDGRWMLDGDKLTFLTSLLATVWKGGGGLSQAERSVFSTLLPLFYHQYSEEVLAGDRPVRAPLLRNFYSWLERYDEQEREDTDYRRIVQNFDIDQFLLTLKPFVDGEYRGVLNAEQELDITDFPLVAFDMARVKSNLQLYPIVALLITDLALSQVRGFPDARKFIYMDEAWSMLAESMGEFVELMYRTIRKNNGSMCIITQGVEEITRSSVGAAIIANAATQIILNHNDESQIAKVGKVFGFTEHEIAKIRSIRVGPDWRELFVKQGDYGRVYVLDASPHLTAVLSSRPEERNHLSRLIEQRGSSEAGLNQYLEDRLQSQSHV